MKDTFNIMACYDTWIDWICNPCAFPTVTSKNVCCEKKAYSRNVFNAYFDINIVFYDHYYKQSTSQFAVSINVWPLSCDFLQFYSWWRRRRLPWARRSTWGGCRSRWRYSDQVSIGCCSRHCCNLVSQTNRSFIHLITSAHSAGHEWNHNESNLSS